MITLKEAKTFLRIDEEDEEEDSLIASLIVTAETLVEGVLRRRLSDYQDPPEPVRQAALILVGTLYEERQIAKGKEGISVADTLDLIRRMLFAYRREAF